MGLGARISVVHSVAHLSLAQNSFSLLLSHRPVYDTDGTQRVIGSSSSIHYSHRRVLGPRTNEDAKNMTLGESVLSKQNARQRTLKKLNFSERTRRVVAIGELLVRSESPWVVYVSFKNASISRMSSKQKARSPCTLYMYGGHIGLLHRP